jgi:Zn-dependent protease
MEQLSGIQQFAVWVLPVLFAITLHEVAHGWVAKLHGDNTAKMMGRLTLNPLKHIDPVGTVLVPGILFMLGGFIFGWAKPVPVDFKKLRHPKRDMAIVALAGPLANLLMAIGWALIAKFAIWLGVAYISKPLIFMGYAGITINLVLMLLNLLPIPPLDGGRIVAGILPARLELKFSRIEPYGFFILVALLATGLLGRILGYPLFLLQKTMLGFAGLL